jgi:hypothetical protein
MLTTRTVRFDRAAALIAAICVASACQKWVPLEPLPLALEAQACRPLPDRDDLRLRASDGTVREGKLISLSDDSLSIGWDRETAVSISLDQVREAEARLPDGRKTAVTGIGIGLAAVALAATVTAIEGSEAETPAASADVRHR